MRAPCLFISYRRDDAAGYAGRLEDALERALGPGSVFRDVADIAPGEDFAALIRQRLAGAQGVLVLIGPRWAGGDTPGQRRIDDPADLLRIEVEAALSSGARVVPLLLPGARMPSEDALPGALRGLAGRNALAISERHWDADVQRLLAAFELQAAPRGARPRRRSRALAGLALLVALAAGLWWALRPAPDPAARLLGRWQAEVRYDWGDRHVERFEFHRHAGELTGTASFLRVPRPIRQLRVDAAGNLHFETRTLESMGDASREKTHAYAAELRGQPPDERLLFRLQTSGGFQAHPPLSFEARRLPAQPAASAPR